MADYHVPDSRRFYPKQPNCVFTLGSGWSYNHQVFHNPGECPNPKHYLWRGFGRCRCLDVPVISIFVYLAVVGIFRFPIGIHGGKWSCPCCIHLSTEQVKRITTFFTKLQGVSRADDCKILNSIVYYQKRAAEC